MEKIKIIHIAQAAGGVDRYLKMLFKYMDSTLFENILICSEDFKADDYKSLVDDFVHVEMHREISINDLSAAAKIRKLIKKYDPDIVYTHSSKAGAIGRLADIGLHNRCIYNPHGWAFNMKVSPLKKEMYIIIEKMVAVFCSKIICISDAERRSALREKICGAPKLQVIYNGVDVDEYDKRPKGAVGRADLNIPEDAVVIGMVGRVSQQKAPDIFIRAAKLIKEKEPKAYFVIVGNGDMEIDIHRYAKDNGLDDSLLITGWVDSPLDYVELFDVALLLSRWEGFGLALPEYMMAGKPIVASNVDAIPDIIKEHVNGLLVPPEDEDAAYHAVMEILSDNNLRDKLIQNGLKDVHTRFNVKRVAREHEELFIKLISN